MKISQNITVCYFGTYRAEYGRNQIMIEGLRQAGIQVIECHESLWKGVEDRVEAASGGWLKPAFLGRVIHTYARLLSRYKKIGAYDLLIVGYPGQIDVYLARLLSWIDHRKMVWDVLVSIFLISKERQLDHASPLTVKLLGLIERTACYLPDLLVLDTPESIEWFAATYKIATDRFIAIPSGADDRFFHPADIPKTADGSIRVLYYGTFIPNHGIRTIIEAARLLVDQADIQFIMIGDGPEREPSVNLVQQYQLENVIFYQWMEKSDLIGYIQQSDIILGSFADRPQSRMTVHNKVYEGMATGKPVITRDSPAIRSILEDQVQVYLCLPENPKSLADAVAQLAKDPVLRQKISDNALKYYNEHFNIEHIGIWFANQLIHLLESRS